MPARPSDDAWRGMHGARRWRIDGEQTVWLPGGGVEGDCPVAGRWRLLHCSPPSDVAHGNVAATMSVQMGPHSSGSLCMHAVTYCLSGSPFGHDGE